MNENFERDVNIYMNELLNDDELMNSEDNMIARLCAFLVVGNLVGFNVDELNDIAKELSADLLSMARHDESHESGV